MSDQHFKKTVRIPIITNLVVPGNPALKIKVNNTVEGVEGDKQAFDLRLKAKIEELKNTIGQEEGDNIARAHAIRAEANGTKKKISDTHHEINIDRERAKVIKKLSGNSSNSTK